MLRRLLPFALLLAPAVARAEDPPFSDLAGREPIAADLQPRPSALSLSPSGHAELTGHVGLRQRADRQEVRGMVSLSIPTDRWLLAARSAKEVHPVVELDEPGRGADEDAPPASSGAPGAVSRSIALPRIRTRDARAAVSAALTATSHDAVRARLDDLDTRARWSAVLPKTRVRVTRLIDESTALSPTSYDADRTTARGGTSLWMEGRATWTLDRLVFADEELRTERHRARLRDRERDLTEEVLDTLVAWQEHVHLRYDPFIAPDLCLKHAIRADGLAVRADLLTDGWFERWRRQHPLPQGDCLAEDGDVRGRPAQTRSTAAEELAVARSRERRSRPRREPAGDGVSPGRRSPTHPRPSSGQGCSGGTVGARCRRETASKTPHGLRGRLQARAAPRVGLGAQREWGPRWSE